MEYAVSVGVAKDLERVPVQGMAVSNYPDRTRIPLDVGSVSWFPLNHSMSGLFRFSPKGA